VDGLWAPKSEDIGLIVRAVSFQDFLPMWSWSTNVTDRQTDGETDRQTTVMQSQDHSLRYSASRGKQLIVRASAFSTTELIFNSGTFSDII